MIEIDIQKRLDSRTLSLSIDIKRGTITGLFGESGVGKTTILRVIAGLDSADRGVIRVGDSVWFDSKSNINLSPQKRRVGFVFQSYALFPNMSIIENILFAQAKRDKTKALELLDMVGLKDFANRGIESLSGGEKQRVALVRAIAQEPEILLMDEPLSALDLEIRKRLQKEIVEIQKRLSLTVIFVSHDREEILRVCDSVVVLNRDGSYSSGKADEVLGFNRGSLKGEIIDIRGEKAVVLIGDNIIEIEYKEGYSVGGMVEVG